MTSEWKKHKIRAHTSLPRNLSASSSTGNFKSWFKTPDYEETSFRGSYLMKLQIEGSLVHKKKSAGAQLCLLPSGILQAVYFFFPRLLCSACVFFLVELETNIGTNLNFITSERCRALVGLLLYWQETNCGGSCSADFGLQMDTLPIRDHHLGVCGGGSQHTRPLHTASQKQGAVVFAVLHCWYYGGFIKRVLFSDNWFESVAAPQAKQALRMCLGVQLLTGDMAWRAEV